MNLFSNKFSLGTSPTGAGTDAQGVAQATTADTSGGGAGAGAGSGNGAAGLVAP